MLFLEESMASPVARESGVSLLPTLVFALLDNVGSHPPAGMLTVALMSTQHTALLLHRLSSLTEHIAPHGSK